ncbi:MAG: PrsW family intramembrane metalloprotease, partial [Salinibacterium sp.]|nr:PrsW family intramembrane metalloprotease [Salinibacterium sp.]
FAFTENILYFGSQLIAQEGIVEVFIVRGIMSPFAHLMFTAFVGIALGLAARRGGTLRAIGYFIVGLVPAILLHAFWNGALFYVSGSDILGYYFFVQVPLFLATIGLVIFLRRQESKLTHDRLAEYAAVGWINPDEVNALATRQGRRQAIAWAARLGKADAMKRYIKDATRLAFARQRIITGRDRIGARADEAELLSRMVASRAALVPMA